jgi:hypothetical protein
MNSLYDGEVLSSVCGLDSIGSFWHVRSHRNCFFSSIDNEAPIEVMTRI